MEAANHLTFVKPFDISEPQRPHTEREREHEGNMFGAIIYELMDKRPTNVERYQMLNPDGFFTLSEASYRIDAPDGSHLHVLAFNITEEEEMVSAGLSLNEHLDDGTMNGGVTYLFEPEGISRSENPSMVGVEDRPVDPIDNYASMIRLRKEVDELRDYTQSDDVELAMEAIVLLAEADDMNEEYMLEHDAGFDGLEPHLGELDKVYDLIRNAVPFPLNR